MQTQQKCQPQVLVPLLIFACEICGEINSKTLRPSEVPGGGECDFCGAAFSPAVACRSATRVIEALPYRTKPR